MDTDTELRLVVDGLLERVAQQELATQVWRARALASGWQPQEAQAQRAEDESDEGG